MAKLESQECAGFTLIETMLAALILGMAIAGTTSMLGIGTSLETEDGLRRQARMYLARSLERDIYDYSGYVDLAVTGGPIPTPVTLKTSSDLDVPATLS